MIFNQHAPVRVGHVSTLPLQYMFAGETGLYQASPEFAFKHGGLITKEFLRQCPLTGNVIIDVRIHHLRKDEYPAIPGFHLDWIPRKNKGTEPDMTRIPSGHHVVMIIGETSLTEFLDIPLELEFPDTQPFAYANSYIKDHRLPVWNVSSGDLVRFTSRDWHRPVPAQGTEWRLFIRASQVEVRPANQIRTQSQVYIPIQEARW